MNKISTRGIWAAIAFCIAGVLSGCGDRVLEADNASIKNGKLYRDGADEPFTGKVTNVRDALILGGQVRPVLASLQNTIKDGRLADRVLLLSGSVCDAKVKDGVFNGETVCKYSGTDAKRWLLSFRDGRLDGDVTFYGPPPENYRLISVRYDKGVLDGPLEIFSAVNGKRVLQASFKAGVEDGDEIGWNEETGNLTAKGTYVAGKLEGQLVRYAPDGKTVLYRATYDHSLFNGLEEAFDGSTGKPLKRIEWSQGRKNGSVRLWNAQGDLVSDETYTNDVLVPKAPSTAVDGTTVDACISSWTVAFRKESGEDAPVNNDQLQEWAEWCKQGKRPA